ncbi:MAG: hypothetical protein Q9167_002407 [Letrouitia subvulpina]
MGSSNTTPPNPDQLSPFPGVQRLITTHDDSGLATFHSTTPGQWKHLTEAMAFNVIYTSSVTPPDLNADADIHAHESLMSSGKLGLVNPHGSVCRMVDFAPLTPESKMQPVMHRTQSLDYGIVVAGEIQLELDSGEKRIMRVGDVAVQRGTMHAWRNTSSTEWARMVFVLIESERVNVGGKQLGTDLEGAPEELRDGLKGEYR